MLADRLLTDLLTEFIIDMELRGSYTQRVENRKNVAKTGKQKLDSFFAVTDPSLLQC